ncbi:MAG: hypothetical protein P4L86_22495 [Mycobacterium sp.]|nr:hypothetical protein [Mycobacterium sp.]
MVPIAITQPLTLTHWNSAAPKNVSGRPAAAVFAAPGFASAMASAR